MKQMPMWLLFDVLEGTNCLKPNLTDELDYTLVPRQAWERLVSWYGLAEGQVGVFTLPICYKLMIFRVSAYAVCFANVIYVHL